MLFRYGAISIQQNRRYFDTALSGTRAIRHSDPTSSPATGSQLPSEDAFSENNLSTSTTSVLTATANLEEAKYRARNLRALSHAAGQYMDALIGSDFDSSGKSAPNYVLAYLNEQHCNPSEEPLRALMLLDERILSGDHYTVAEEQKLRDAVHECRFRNDERVQVFWERYFHAYNLMNTVTGATCAPADMWARFYAQYKSHRRSALPRQPYAEVDMIIRLSNRTAKASGRNPTMKTLQQLIEDITCEQNENDPLPPIASKSNRRFSQAGYRKKNLRERLLLQENDT